MPILQFDTLEAIPEGLRGFAKPDEASGKVTVNVVPEVKLSEFRDKNIELSKAQEEMTAKLTRYAGIVGEDPDTFQTDLEDMKAVRQRVKDGDLKEGRQIQEELARRTEDMRKGYTDQLAAEAKEKALWRQKAEQENARYREQVIVASIRDACGDPDLGVVSSAVNDITERAKRVFKVGDDGKLTAYNGDAMIYGADGASSISTREWVGKLKEDAPFFFKGSHGGGAGGEGNGGNGGKKIAGQYSQEQWGKMDARQRLAAANGEPQAGL